MINIEKISIGGQYNPVCIGVSNPSFSWIIHSDESGLIQTEYRIIVWNRESKDQTRKSCLWDTGYIVSGRTTGIVYQGAKLKNLTDYYWKVIIKTNRTDTEIESPDGYFGTAILEPQEWKANWIGGNGLLRGNIELEQKPETAKVCVTGLGYYELYINGNKVGTNALTPSYTDYEKRIEYQCYTVAEYLKAGKNAVGILLGSHWEQNPDGTNSQCYQQCYYRGPLKAIFQLSTQNGNQAQTFLSDSTWKCGESPVVSSCIYDGETYDARKYEPEWSAAIYDDSSWDTVTIYENNNALLAAEALPPIQITEELKPVRIYKLPNGDHVIDFGCNISGRIRLSIDGESGLPIKIRHAEVLNKDGSICQANLRRAKAKDVFICAGNGYETYEPHFTYHGFRYVQISNYPGILNEDRIAAMVVHSSVRETGHFHCSDDMLNKIHENMRRTISNNLHSIPTDCCQRDERQGWMGDAQITCEAAISNFDMQYFYRKWLDDLADTMDETGNLPFLTAPGWIAAPAFSWTCAYPVILWNLYHFYDDEEAVKKHYPHIKRYFQYLMTKENEKGLLTLPGLGDWLAVEPTEEGNIRDALYYQFAKILQEISPVSGNKNDAPFYAEKSKKIAIAYNDTYYSPHESSCRSSGYYGTCYYIGQLANALPIALGLTEQKNEARIKEKLVYELTESMGSVQLTTGLIGTKFLFDALMRMDRNDLAYQLMKRKEYPSWGFMLEHEATTVWERWQYRTDNEMNSHCHPPLCAPDTWFYRVLGGIKDSYHDENGRRVFLIRPWFHEEIDYVECCQDTIWGAVQINWRKIGLSVFLNIDIPANTSAIVEINKNGTTEKRILSAGKFVETI